MSTNLTNNGQLAQVWLAANLDKKFNKHQSLQADIISSSKEIARAATSREENVEHIGLRISGHLLYGVVRIYSNKTKYLLDDISETLVRLKSSFKANPRQVTQAIGSTVVSNVNNLIMQDTITAAELFYQEPLDFLSGQEMPEGLLNRNYQGMSGGRDNNLNRKLAGTGASNFNAEAIPNIESPGKTHVDFFDDSLEIGRGYAVNLLENSGLGGDYSQLDNQVDDQDFDLDFDISGNMQASVLDEGTANSHSSHSDATMPPQHNTVIDQDQDGNNDDHPMGGSDIDLSMEVGRNAGEEAISGDALFDMDLGLGDDNDDDDNNNNYDNQREVTLIANENRMKSNSNAVLKNTKEIMEDEQIEIDEANNMLNTPTSSPARKGKVQNNKRIVEQIYEQTYNYLPQNMYETLLQIEKKNSHKKLKLLSLDTLPSPEQDAHSNSSFNGLENSEFDISLNLGDHHEETFNSENDHFEMDMQNNDEDNSAPLDMHEHSLYGDDSTASSSSSSSSSADTAPTQTVMQIDGQMVSKSTVDVANALRENLTDSESLKFSTLLDVSSTTIRITKAEACKTFFQILSLASSDCISVSQEASSEDIVIEGKPGLYEKFITT